MENLPEVCSSEFNGPILIVARSQHHGELLAPGSDLAIIADQSGNLTKESYTLIFPDKTGHNGSFSFFEGVNEAQEACVWMNERSKYIEDNMIADTVNKDHRSPWSYISGYCSELLLFHGLKSHLPRTHANEEPEFLVKSYDYELQVHSAETITTPSLDYEHLAQSFDLFGAPGGFTVTVKTKNGDGGANDYSVNFAADWAREENVLYAWKQLVSTHNPEAAAL